MLFRSSVQTPQAILTIAMLLGIGTIGLLAFGVVVSLRFRLGPVTHAMLMEEIEHLRTGATEPTDAAHKAVVEDLSGWRYDQLWGRNSVAAPTA